MDRKTEGTDYNPTGQETSKVVGKMGRPKKVGQ